MVTIRNVGFANPRLCIEGKFYSPPKSKDVSDGFEVPAGTRITISAFWSLDVFQCHPSFSFVPTYGSAYVLNAGPDGERCGVELVRVDTNSVTGLAVERTIGPQDWSATDCPLPFFMP